MRHPLSLLALCASLLAPPIAAQEAPPGEIVVTGEGRVAAAPDMARLRLGAQAQAEEPGEALDAASASARALVETLRAAGIEEADIQTAELSLDPRYDERTGSGEVTGYVATDVVTVQVRDLDGLGAVLDAAVEAGANRLDGLSFSLSDPGPAREEARRRAVADATGAAETLADAAGVALGPVLRMEEIGAGDPFPSPPMLRAEGAVAVAPGRVETVAGVRMAFALGGAAEE